MLERKTLTLKEYYKPPFESGNCGGVFLTGKRSFFHDFSPE